MTNMELTEAEISTLAVKAKDARSAGRHLAWSLPAMVTVFGASLLLIPLDLAFGLFGVALIGLLFVVPLGIYVWRGLDSVLFGDMPSLVLAGRQPVISLDVTVDGVTGEDPYPVSVAVDHPRLGKGTRYLHLRSDAFGEEVELTPGDHLVLYGFGTRPRGPFSTIVALETATGQRIWRDSTFVPESRYHYIEPFG
ncbi:hypothetical protein FB566_4469 [Stackebrandtia endophytica]|uniref:Uncharacterized protein n=1 Tax=Stackebrandtia endophytica TaxID=1496996 RepID=A0A543B226_9ACTN|nr:hypothetical protein [Stackebrandtia endophytica]TQL78874.1 hypothetical protein FB566_4469 [Stackebrandtia endophytica]